MDAAKEPYFPVGIEIDAYSRDHDLHPIGPDSRRADSLGITSGVIRSSQADVLVTDAGRHGPAVPSDLVLEKKGSRLSITDPVGLASRSTKTGSGHAASAHLETILVLEPILLILVVAKAEFKSMLGSSQATLQAQYGLDTLRVISPVVGPDFQHVRITVLPTGDVQLAGVLIGVPENSGDTVAANALELEPVPGKVVAIDDGGQVQPPGQGQEIAGLVLPVVRVKAVDLRGCIATVGIAGKIEIGQTQIGFFRVLFGGAELHLELLEDPGVQWRLKPKLGHVVSNMESGVPSAVQFLEAIRFHLIAFHQPPEVAM